MTTTNEEWEQRKDVTVRFILSLQGEDDLLSQDDAPVVDDETLAFLTDIERIKDECYHGMFKFFMAAIVKILERARDNNQDPMLALEEWVEAKLATLDPALN